ncbi:unnamed protein product [Phytomonas sp. EM1]|nr:unnamed protein product [Phytomonas sp. EM1]|eukprot:CCW61088.1 unnamed protein product [Phytomonas sp. isolate EM1]
MRELLSRVEAIHEATRKPYEETQGASFRRREGELEERKRQRQFEKLSPFKQAELKCMECVAELRFCLRVCSNLEASSSSSDKRSSERAVAQARLAARRAHQRLRTLHQEVERLHRARSNLNQSSPRFLPSPPTTISTRENQREEDEEEEDFKKLCDHVERARQWYREEFRIMVVSSAESPRPFSYLRSSSHAADPHSDDDDETHPLLHEGRGEDAHPPVRTRENAPLLERREEVEKRMIRYAREDAEFRTFFESLRQNDALMDQALDRIEASVYRLRDHAMGVSHELDAQQVLLNETEVRVNENERELRSLNRRLQRSISEVKSSTVGSYVFCTLCLLFVLSLLIRVAS